jgi:8-oxo-dGTP pyrophosphatase MutT (NUDIX family)
VYLLSGELIVPKDAPNDLIRASGGIIRRFVSGGRVEVACIYREARGDWTFPKGKIDQGETFEMGALREVEEETGMRCTVIRFAGTTNYTHRKGKPKIVAYYLMEANTGEFCAERRSRRTRVAAHGRGSFAPHVGTRSGTF